MTWIIFDNKILHPESGASFDRIQTGVSTFSVTYSGPSDEVIYEGFPSIAQAEQRFEELKLELIRKPRLLINPDGSIREILSGEDK